ncbi:MAG: hypothetical protein WA705_21740 [Candidatus Ozemobacteraceae bacterium]
MIRKRDHHRSRQTTEGRAERRPFVFPGAFFRTFFRAFFLLFGFFGVVETSCCFAVEDASAGDWAVYSPSAQKPISLPLSKAARKKILVSRKVQLPLPDSVPAPDADQQTSASRDKAVQLALPDYAPAPDANKQKRASRDNAVQLALPEYPSVTESGATSVESGSTRVSKSSVVARSPKKSVTKTTPKKSSPDLQDETYVVYRGDITGGSSPVRPRSKKISSRTLDPLTLRDEGVDETRQRNPIPMNSVGRRPVILPLPGYTRCADTPDPETLKAETLNLRTEKNTAIVELGHGRGSKLGQDALWEGDAAFSGTASETNSGGASGGTSGASSGGGDGSSGDSSEKPVERPTITGAHNWKYNKFSSYDQLRINFEKEGKKGQKFYSSVHGLYYQEADNKNWNTYLGESYYKFKVKSFDFKFGLLTETLGSGDKVSFVDKLNSRRYQNGLANDYNRDKKEVPAFKTTYYINKKMSFDFHYLPIFQACELPDIFSRWATSFQKNLALHVLFGAQLQQELDQTAIPQYHVAFNSSFKKYELRYHYFWFKERLPVVERLNEGMFKLTYPTDQTFALDGNVTLSKEFLMRFEFACTTDKAFSSYEKDLIGPKYYSDMYNLLLGTDKTYHNNLYLNVQTLVSFIKDFIHKTPAQLNQCEIAGSISMKKGFRNETLFVEFNGLQNFTSGEYVLTPNIQMQRRDSLKMTVGVHINGKSTESLGPIGQFDMNNTPFFETTVIF